MTNMNYDNVLLEKIYKMYCSDFIGQNEICIKCQEYAKQQWFPLTNGPVPIFHIGKDFAKHDVKLLIVGKVAYGWNDYSDIWNNIFSGNQDSRTYMKNLIEERVEELFYRRDEESDTVYFSFLNKSLTAIFGNIDDAFNRIAITNFVHCNDGNVNDYLRQKNRYYCASKVTNGFIHKEIEILNPSHILVLTNTIQGKYERYLKDENLNVKFIEHPSSPGRTISGFTEDIKSFIEL